MASEIYTQIKTGFRNLNPEHVRGMAERRVRIGLIASTSESFSALEALFEAPTREAARAREVEHVGEGLADRDAAGFDLIVSESELLAPPDAFSFDPSEPRRTISEIVERREDLRLALARNCRLFRQPVISKVIKSVARENAVFCLLTALPDVLPSLIELPWAVGEFASDTAFLTMNQVRMAFMIAGASDRDIGYREQRAQIAAIVGGAFGWRALARELTGKIPFGGGLIPKAAISFAGTYTVGVGLERFYRIGYGLTRAERRQIYEQAFERGRSVVNSIVEKARTGGRARVEVLNYPEG